MSAFSIKDQSICKGFNSVYQIVRDERNRTKVERKAFKVFRQTVVDLEPSENPLENRSHDRTDVVGGALSHKPSLLFSPSTNDHFTQIREAYEETVMDVPFYQTEYGDTYEESICDEFGREVATALVHGSDFSHTVKRLLLGKVKQATNERELLITTCERERKSVEKAASVLKPIENELNSFDTLSLTDEGFGALEAHRAQLLILQDKCEQAAATRQATIHYHWTKYDSPVDDIDLYAYLYESIEPTYPVLFFCSELAQRINSHLQQVEHEMCVSS